MSVRINPVDDQIITFELPHNGNFIEVKVPALDCIAPKSLDVASKAAEEKGIPLDHSEFVRLLLGVVGKSSSKALTGCVDNLTTRQLVQISDAWDKASTATVGESVSSGE